MCQRERGADSGRTLTKVETKGLIRKTRTANLSEWEMWVLTARNSLGFKPRTKLHCARAAAAKGNRGRRKKSYTRRKHDPEARRLGEEKRSQRRTVNTSEWEVWGLTEGTRLALKPRTQLHCARAAAATKGNRRIQSAHNLRRATQGEKHDTEPGLHGEEKQGVCCCCFQAARQTCLSE